MRCNLSMDVLCHVHSGQCIHSHRQYSADSNPLTLTHTHTHTHTYTHTHTHTQQDRRHTTHTPLSHSLCFVLLLFLPPVYYLLSRSGLPSLHHTHTHTHNCFSILLFHHVSV